MDALSPFPLLLAFFWGLSWSLFLYQTRFGRYLAYRQTWLVVMLSIAGDIVIIACHMPWEVWSLLLLVLGASAAPFVGMAIFKEFAEYCQLQEELDDKNESAE